MTFGRPEWLWALIAVAALAASLVVGAVRRARSSRRFGTLALDGTMLTASQGRLRAVRGIVLVLGLTLLVLAVADPRYGSRTRMLRKRGVDVVLAIDFSKSMLARDVRPNRIDRAKAELERLLRDLDGDRVGVVAFAGDTMEFPMTVDHGAIQLFLRDLGPYDMPVGGTAIGRALVAAGRLLERSSAAEPQAGAATDGARRSRVVLLITDGEDHEGDPLTAARELAAKDIKVITIGIGSRSGETIPTYAPDGTWTGHLRDEDGRPVLTAFTATQEQQLQSIAQATGGKYLRAREGTVGIEEIRRELRALKQTEQRARRVTIEEPRYALALLPAFLLLLLESLLPEAWTRVRRRREGVAR